MTDSDFTLQIYKLFSNSPNFYTKKNREGGRQWSLPILCLSVLSGTRLCICNGLQDLKDFYAWCVKES